VISTASTTIGSSTARLASINRIERIIARPKARIVVQHDLADFNAMPNKFPAYLE
jgi:archaeosine-15-forming tRNA-guanine transglycosylase